MKIKRDFVTNSSSTSYIISGSESLTKSKLKFNPVYDEEITFMVIKNKRQLINYVNDYEASNSKIDWVSEVIGPKNYYGMNRDSYELCLKEILEGKIITLITISYHEDITHFEQQVSKKHNILSSSC